jgi:hypothetical protein
MIPCAIGIVGVQIGGTTSAVWVCGINIKKINLQLVKLTTMLIVATKQLMINEPAKAIAAFKSLFSVVSFVAGKFMVRLTSILKG